VIAIRTRAITHTVLSPMAGSDYDRCTCHGRSDTCCLKSGVDSEGNQMDATFDETYDEDRTHDVRESCKEDSEYDWDATKAGYSPGYLLRANSGNGHRHDFSVRITLEDYPCNDHMLGVEIHE